jgi:hypothetical protein
MSILLFNIDLLVNKHFLYCSYVVTIGSIAYNCILLFNDEPKQGQWYHIAQIESFNDLDVELKLSHHLNLYSKVVR